MDIYIIFQTFNYEGLSTIEEVQNGTMNIFNFSLSLILPTSITLYNADFFMYIQLQTLFALKKTKENRNC